MKYLPKFKLFTSTSRGTPNCISLLSFTTEALIYLILLFYANICCGWLNLV
jgi:hypothetical protein